MSQTVKIDCFTLKLKKHGEDTFIGFEELFESQAVKIKKESSEEDLVDNTFYGFFSEYVKSFDNKFHVHKSSGKALCAHPKLFYPNKTLRVISGIVEGGGTGMVSKIKSKEKFDDEDAFEVTTDHVNAIPYYYLLWIPERGNVGLLIVQSFSTRSITEPLKAHLRGFFSKHIKGYSLRTSSYIPKEAVKEVKEKGAVNKVILRKHKLGADLTSELIPEATYSAMNTVDIEVVIKGLKNVAGWQEAVNEFITGNSTQLIDIENLTDLGIDGTHETLLEFEHKGKTALAKMSNNFDLNISFYVDDSDIEKDINNYPTYKSMHAYVLSYLRGVQDEIKIPDELKVPDKIKIEEVVDVATNL